MENKTGKKFQLTINNPQDKGLTHTVIKEKLSELKNILYWVMADEEGLDSKTPHTHVFFMSKNSIRFSTIKKLFPDAHIEVAKGSAKENRDYVLKAGKWASDEKADTKIEGSAEESGELPEERGQGHRSDIEDLYNMILDGKTNAEIMAERPSLALHIGKMEKIRQEIIFEQFRDEFRHLTVTYIWGKTGVGKTRYVMEKYGYRNVHHVTDYLHPYEKYFGQDVICYEEYRSSFTMTEILQYLDGYPLSLPARYENKTACFTKVYIISNIDLKEQYPFIQREEPETWKAFLRRIHKVIEFDADGNQIDHGSGLDYVFPPDPDWLQEAEAAPECTQLQFTENHNKK